MRTKNPQRELLAAHRQLDRRLELLEVAVGPGDDVRAHRRRGRELGNLPLALHEGALEQAREVRVLRERAAGLVDRLGDVVHVRQVDGAVAGDQGDRERRLEERLVPAGERAAGGGGLELGEGVVLLDALVLPLGTVLAHHAPGEGSMEGDGQGSF